MNTIVIDNDTTKATLGMIREAGLAKLTPVIRDFLEGGAGAEFTLRRNLEAFNAWTFSPRVMSGNDFPSTATSFLGIDLALPVLTAPFGADKLFHPEGQRAVTKAAAAAGTASIVPEASSFSLEELAAGAPTAAVIGQLHPMGLRENVIKIIRRYEDVGYRALCLTVDCPTVGWREHNLRNGYVVTNDVVGGNYSPGSESAMEEALGQLYVHQVPVWSWEQLQGVMSETTLPWIAKGILTPTDARRAADAGAAAVLVSNHGGRQLDGSPSSLEVLPAIAAELHGEIPIALDSGIRRGSDVLKALALGADVVIIGRLAAYGLAANGQEGVEKVFELLQREMLTTLQLLGRGDARDLDAQAVTATKGWGP
jgi:isopentenyl diphosphate isomerase/L-lactate dehydrogenase-like FMN-dependent dehydrogenase